MNANDSNLGEHQAWRVRFKHVQRLEGFFRGSSRDLTSEQSAPGLFPDSPLVSVDYEQVKYKTNENITTGFSSIADAI